MHDGPTALYRYFDDKDRLLYVGISGSLVNREQAHISASIWMEWTARSTVERYPSRDEALKAERGAIETEQPVFNCRHNDTPESREWLKAYLREMGRIDLLETVRPSLMVKSAPPSPPLRPAPMSPTELSEVVSKLVGLVEDITGVTDLAFRLQEDVFARVSELERRLKTRSKEAPEEGDEAAVERWNREPE